MNRGERHSFVGRHEVCACPDLRKPLSTSSIDRCQLRFSLVFVLLAAQGAWPRLVALSRSIVARVEVVEVVEVVSTLWLPVLGGGVVWYLTRRRVKKTKLNENLRNAWEKVQRIHKPEILSPDHQGNLEFMREEAQVAVDGVMKTLEDAGIDDHPGLIDTSSKESTEAWYNYLRFKRWGASVVRVTGWNRQTTGNLV